LFLFDGEQSRLVGFCDPDAFLQCTAQVSFTGNVLTLKLTNTSPAAKAVLKKILPKRETGRVRYTEHLGD
jgi:hypothetical protein